VGEGLGNQFLANIRETDAICEVVRYFTDENIIHVEGKVNPESDVETIRTELVLADLGTLERARPRLEKEAKRDKSVAEKLAMMDRLEEWMNQGHRAGKMEMTAEDRVLVYDLHLLTMKPMLYVANVDESQVAESFAPIDGVTPIPICARVEADLADLEPDEAAEYLTELGLSEPGLNALIREAYRLLGLQSYFTAGEIEVRAWTVPIGAKAPQAAGVIHTDFERGFIKAEVIGYEDYVALGGEKGAKEAGKMRLEGKEYVMADGDVVDFKFNV
jgi:GTP-binding protein YchF